jgi:hypothetical protein
MLSAVQVRSVLASLESVGTGSAVVAAGINGHD